MLVVQLIEAGRIVDSGRKKFQGGKWRTVCGA
jgi:hypothetical protein